jgi:hypothetical protein
LYDIQITILDPELINDVWNLKDQRYLSAGTSSIAAKPSPKRFGAEIQPDSARYFPPYPIANLFA